MNTQFDSTNHSHLPLALLSLTIAVLLASQIGASMQGASLMRWQSESAQKQITNMQAADKQVAEALKNRESVVKQSGELQNQLQTLLNEVLDLSKDDKDAQAIIKKWNVQRNTPPAASAEGSGTPASATPALDAASKAP